MSSIPGSFPLALLYGRKEEFKQEGREKRKQHKIILFLLFGSLGGREEKRKYFFLPLFVG